MKRTSLNVLGQKLTIKKRKLAELCGYYDPAKGEIVISSDLKTDLDRQTTLMHEVVHAVLVRTGAAQTIDPSLQEVICETISQTFYELGARIR